RLVHGLGPRHARLAGPDLPVAHDDLSRARVVRSQPPAEGAGRGEVGGLHWRSNPRAMPDARLPPLRATACACCERVARVRPAFFLSCRALPVAPVSFLGAWRRKPTSSFTWYSLTSPSLTWPRISLTS